MENKKTTSKVSSLLTDSLSPSLLEIEDRSDEHIGHRESEGMSHYFVRIACDGFKGLSHLERHRLVYKALGDLNKINIHSLAIEAILPTKPDN